MKRIVQSCFVAVNDTSYATSLNLGSNLVSGDDATIEIWVKCNS